MKLENAVQVIMKYKQFLNVLKSNIYFFFFFFFITTCVSNYWIYRYTFQHAGAHDENFETSSNYSNDNEKEEIDCYSGDSVFNGSSISTITKPPNRSKTIVDIGFVEQINNIRLCLQDINSQLKCLSKKQDQIENKISSSLFTNKTDICRNLEPFLIGTSTFN
jgi:hypothetical protein